MNKKDNRIGFSHVIDMMSTLSLSKTSTKFGDFYLGSPLSYQLAVFNADFEILSCDFETSQTPYNDLKLLDVNLPTLQISEFHETFPTDWGMLSYTDMMTLEAIFPETLEKENWNVKRLAKQQMIYGYLNVQKG